MSWHPLVLLVYLAALPGALSQSPSDAPPPKGDTPQIQGRETQQQIQGWGLATDAAGDCRFKLRDGQLTLTVAGDIREHWLEQQPNTLPAPRILNICSGDFTMEVKVHSRCSPASDLTQGYSGASADVGLVVMADSKNFVSLARTTHEIECSTEQPAKREWREWWVQAGLGLCLNGKTIHLNFVEPGVFEEKDDVWLRFTSKGNVITPAWSVDGTDWKSGPIVTLPVMDAKKPVVSAGLFATSTAAKEFAPVLSGFSLQRAGKPAAEETTTAAAETQQQIAGWGQASDKAGDCRFQGKDGSLTITVPPDVREHWIEEHPNTLPAPRVLNSLEGNFTMAVQVSGGCTPESDLTQNCFGAWAKTGLIVMADAKNFVSFARATNEVELKTDGPPRRVWRQWTVFADLLVCVNGKTLEVKLPEPVIFDEKETVWLRLAGKGKTLTASWSRDGNHWNDGPALTLPVPTEKSSSLKGGVMATSGAATEFAPVLSNFSLKTPEKKAIPRTEESQEGKPEAGQGSADVPATPAPPAPRSAPR